MPPDVPNQARFYELQGSLTPGRPSRPPADGERADETTAEAAPRRRGGSGGSSGSGGNGSALPMWLRGTLIVVAALLLAVGVAGLFLPGIQGILTILLGLALLSLVSRRTHRLLRWGLKPWPGLRKRVERIRHRSHRWLHHKVGNGKAGNGRNGTAPPQS